MRIFVPVVQFISTLFCLMNRFGRFLDAALFLFSFSDRRLGFLSYCFLFSFGLFCGSRWFWFCRCLVLLLIVLFSCLGPFLGRLLVFRGRRRIHGVGWFRCHFLRRSSGPFSSYTHDKQHYELRDPHHISFPRFPLDSQQIVLHQWQIGGLVQHHVRRIYVGTMRNLHRVAQRVLFFFKQCITVIHSMD